MPDINNLDPFESSAFNDLPKMTCVLHLDIYRLYIYIDYEQSLITGLVDYDLKEGMPTEYFFTIEVPFI